jgi:Tfp pilus assembly protein FimT
MRVASSERGYTYIEVVVTVLIFMCASGMALAGLSAAMPSLRVNGQLNRLMGALHYARELSISSRRDVEVRFDPEQSSMTVIRRDPGGVETTVQNVVFEYNVRFVKYTGMGDTPEAYGADDVVDFGDAQELLFVSDGSLVDETGIPVNGTIFLGLEGRPHTARAVTLTGSTARARYYTWAPASGSWEAAWIPH